MATQPLWFQLSPLSNLFYLFFFRLRFITSFCPYPSTSPHPHLWLVLCFQLFTQSRSWWIVHTPPTKGLGAHPPKNPPTQRTCQKFVVRPSGGSLYFGFRLI